MKIGHIHRMSMNPCGLRFDSSYHLSDGVTVKRDIAASPYPLMLIGKAAERIFIGGRARRVYVKDRNHGIPFLSSSDILQADLENVKLASKKYTPNIEEMTLQKGWTLITRSGTIGNCAFANAKHPQAGVYLRILSIKAWLFVAYARYIWSCYSTHRTCICGFSTYSCAS